MYRMRGRSRLMTHDERLPVLREGNLEAGAVAYVDGKPVKRAPVTFSVACTVQPMGGKDLLLVPEGDRDKEQFSVWTHDLRMALNDKLLRLGKVYQVQSAENDGSYIKLRLMAVDVGADVAGQFDTQGTEKWSLAPGSGTVTP